LYICCSVRLNDPYHYTYLYICCSVRLKMPDSTPCIAAVQFLNQSLSLHLLLHLLFSLFVDAWPYTYLYICCSLLLTILSWPASLSFPRWSFFRTNGDKLFNLKKKKKTYKKGFFLAYFFSLKRNCSNSNPNPPTPFLRKSLQEFWNLSPW